MAFVLRCVRRQSRLPSRRRATLLALLALAVPLLSIFAATVAHAETEILDLNSAIDIALRENHQYLNVISDAEIAELDYEAARSVFRTRFGSRMSSDARLGAELGSTYSVYLAKDNESGSRYSAGYYNSTFGDRSLSELRFSYTLPFFKNALDSRHLAIDQAEIDMTRSQRLIEIGTEELINAVTTSYYRLVLASRQEELARNRALMTETLLSAQHIRFENGELSELELAESDLAIADAEHRLEQANFEFQKRMHEFRLMLGMDASRPLNVNTDIAVAVDDSLMHAPVEELEQQAMSLRTELIAKREELLMARKVISANTRGTLPPMEISLQYALVAEGDQFSDSLEFDDQRFGVGLRMNTDFGQSEQKLKERKLQLRFAKAQREFDYLREQVSVQIRTARNACAQAKSRASYAAKTLDVAQRKHEHADILRARGRLTELEFLESDQQLADAEQKHLAARIDYLLAAQELAFASGHYGYQWRD